MFIMCLDMLSLRENFGFVYLDMISVERDFSGGFGYGGIFEEEFRVGCCFFWFIVFLLIEYFILLSFIRLYFTFLFFFVVLREMGKFGCFKCVGFWCIFYVFDDYNYEIKVCLYN